MSNPRGKVRLKVDQFRGKTADLATLQQREPSSCTSAPHSLIFIPSEIKHGATLTIMYSEKILKDKWKVASLYMPKTHVHTHTHNYHFFCEGHRMWCPSSTPFSRLAILARTVFINNSTAKLKSYTHTHTHWHSEVSWSSTLSRWQ